MKTARWKLGLLTMGLIAGACGGDEQAATSDGTGGTGATMMPGDVTPVETGVDPDKVASDLTPAEVDALCAEVDSRLNEAFDEEKVAELACQVQGVFAGVGLSLGSGIDLADAGVPSSLGADALTGFDTDTAQMACRDANEACLDQPTAAAAPMAMCDAPGADCEATVGEIEECFTDLLDLLNALTFLLPKCDNLTPLSLLALVGAAPQQPESCTVVEEKCPGQFSTNPLDGLMTSLPTLGGGSSGQ